MLYKRPFFSIILMIASNVKSNRISGGCMETKINAQGKAQIKNITAMAAFGTIAVFVRGIGLSSMETAFWRGIIALFVLGGIQLFCGRNDRSGISFQQKILLFISGMAIGLNWALLFMAYEHTSVAVATLAYYFAPVLVILLTPVLFQEKMTLFQFFCFLAATAGLVMVIGTGNVSQPGNMQGIAYGLGAAVFYAGVILMNKAIPQGSSLERTLIQFAGAAVLLGIILACGQGFHLSEVTASGMVRLFIVGAVHTGLCYWLYFSSVKELPGQQIAILSYIDPLIAILVSVLYFHEPVTFLQGAGAAFILGFTCLYEFVKNRNG